MKLKYPEGEIDFIVTAPVSKLQSVNREVDLSDFRPAYKPVIRVDQPAEIALKKMHYRATMLKPRDVFDIAVVDKIAHDALFDNLHEVAGKRDDLLYRLNNISSDYVEQELAELDIQRGWESEQENCLDIARALVGQIS